MKSLLYLVFGMTLIALLLVQAPVQGQQGKLYEVTVIRNTFKLDPSDITIKIGDTVKWTNTDERKHNIASIPGSGPGDGLEIFSVMEPGDVYTHTFKAPGEYPYFCFIHNQMTGKITVAK